VGEAFIKYGSGASIVPVITLTRGAGDFAASE